MLWAGGAALGAFGVILHRFVILNSLTVLTNLLPFVGLDRHHARQLKAGVVPQLERS